jgi:hypothetical protein
MVQLLLKTGDAMARITAAPPGRALHERREARDDDDASIRAAARATLWFVAIVMFLAWAGAVAA